MTTLPLQSPNRIQLAARPTRGASIVECLIVLVVAAVTLGLVAPGWGAARERRHLDGVAAQLETDLHQVRTLAVAMNRTLRVSFEQGSAGSCYFVHTGSPDACSCSPAGAVCRAGAQVLRTQHIAADSPVALRANVRSMVFDPTLGTVTPTGTMRVEGRSGQAVHQVVNIMGRVRSCSPAPALPGYRAC